MFEKPETFEGLDLDALRALSAEAITEAQAIMSADDADLTDEQIAKAEGLMAASAEIDAEVATRETAEAERAEKIAALRAKSAPADSTPVEDPEEGDDDEDENPDEDAEESDEDADADNKKEVVVAAAPTPQRRTVAVARKQAPEVEAPKPAVASLVAAADVPGYNTGQELVDLDEVAAAFIARSRAFGNSNEAGLDAGVYAMSDNARRFGVARIQKPANEFTTGMDRPLDEQLDTVMAAAKESRLPGGSLVAAGGWCAPSETLYDFCSLETTEGMLSIPEVTARRGGIRFTKGPDFAALLANANFGFRQTEAQAIAGTVKPCYAVECPPFSEVRLDAIGFCITAGVLTNAAYPELIRRVLELAIVGQARRLNAATINAISTAIGTAIDFAEVGSAAADVLDALSLQASRLRYQYSMSPSATLEVVLPVWAKDIIKSDLSRRTGVDMLAVSDADISRYFGNRNLSVQFVYDYQNLSSTNTGTWTSWPDTLEAMLYPAGTFVRLTNDVIDLDTIYDSTGLSTNTYTAAFFEEGFAVANTCGSGVKVSIDVSCLAGVTGAAELSCTTP